MICSRPYHALFMHNMLIRPTREELADFGEPDCVIYNAGEFPANRRTHGHDVEDEHRPVPRNAARLVILGTEYAGEMKKGVFTMMNYFDAQARRPVDALLGHGRPADRPLVAPVRPLGHRQDDALGRSAAGCSSATTSIAGPTTASSTSKAAATPRRST